MSESPIYIMNTWGPVIETAAVNMAVGQNHASEPENSWQMDVHPKILGLWMLTFLIHVSKTANCH